MPCWQSPGSSTCPGCPSGFILDDFPNLRSLKSGAPLPDAERILQFVLGGGSGPTGRPVALASFLIDDTAWPSEPGRFKRTNILFHLLNGALLCWCAVLALRRPDGHDSLLVALTAAAAAGIWLLHPFNVSTVLYVIQRMTLLSATFVLTGLIFYLKGRAMLRARPVHGYALMTTGIVVCGGLGVLSKENAALLPLLVLVTEYTLVRGRELPLPDRGFRVWQSVFLILPVAALAVWHVVKFPSFMSGYRSRPFDLAERLLTESRVLLDYLGYAFVPRRAGTGLFHDDFVISRGLFDPPETAVSVFVVFGLLGLGVLLAKRRPVLAFAILWFFAGHSLEAGIAPLELYFEHRNYLPLAGPILAFAYYGLRLPPPFRAGGYAACRAVWWPGGCGDLAEHYALDEPGPARRNLGQ